MGSCISCYGVVTIKNPTNRGYTVLVFSNDILTFDFDEKLSIQVLPLADKTQFHPFKEKNTHVLVYDFVEQKAVLYKRVKNMQTLTLGTGNTLPQSTSDCTRLARWAENHRTIKAYSYVPGPPPARERVPVGDGLYYVPD